MPESKEIAAGEAPVDTSAMPDGLLGKSSDQASELKRKLMESEKKYDTLRNLAKQGEK